MIGAMTNNTLYGFKAPVWPSLKFHDEAYQQAKRELGATALIREVLFRAEVIRKEMETSERERLSNGQKCLESVIRYR
jgi:hypothetical protein